ncbi:protein-disulfide reductase DsbD [Pleionea litopenaei]|uniref:Thiol:disulfide interchange protein DsbD n=1 Tax=Pleionea litopenaei TaxID=3070815 RepID=A0AA51X5M8_9GAMM|nr:protein-disulfide reductase DsbD [Pleionea sp. HL-JVS1]WMS86302.1 protein-disulfide reductase DsbD [Pleionea sp. HL-JVS1]
MLKRLLFTLFLLTSTNYSAAQEELDLQQLFGQTDEFLEVDQAFQLSLKGFSDELVAEWTIAPEYYLYQHQFAVELKQATLTETFLPDGKHKVDEYFGEVQIYQKQLQLSSKFKDAAETFYASVKFQGCAEAGLCYPPTRRYFAIDGTTWRTQAITAEQFDAAEGEPNGWSAPALKSVYETAEKSPKDNSQNKATDLSSKEAKPKSSNSEFKSEKDRILDTLNNSSLIWAFLSLVVLGIGLAFTPCVFPMMPIISSIIAGEGKDITTSRAFLLSLTYTQFMAIPYVIIGFIVAGIGASVTATLQSPPFVIGAAVVFLILSLGMFGFFEIQLPTALQNKLNNISQQQKSGSYIGAAIMGVVSGAVVSPCVTIPLIAILTWISQVGDPFIGGIYLYGLAVGMGIPLILIGVGGGSLLPRAGNWMNAVKAVFGVLMIGVALYITKHLIPDFIYLMLWGSLLIVCAVFMGALRQVENGWPTFWKGISIVILTYGLTLIIGAAMGNNSLFSPLKMASSGGHSSASVSGNNPQETQQYVDHAGFILIKSTDDLDRYLAQAKAENKTVMLDFFAEYCAACYEFAELTFPDPKVQAALSNTILLQADVTAGDAQDLALMNRFKIFGLPSILFFDLEGNEVTSMRAEGFENAETFAQRIEIAIGH